MSNGVFFDKDYLGDDDSRGVVRARTAADSDDYSLERSLRWARSHFTRSRQGGPTLSGNDVWYKRIVMAGALDVLEMPWLCQEPFELDGLAVYPTKAPLDR